MLKEEFENLIGKRVTGDTFREYEKMYMSIDRDKREFVAMLNLDAIPEDPAAVEARQARAALLQAQKDKISELKQEVKINEENAKYYMQYFNDRPQAAYYKEAAKVAREELRKEKQYLQFLTA